MLKLTKNILHWELDLNWYYKQGHAGGYIVLLNNNKHIFVQGAGQIRVQVHHPP